MDEQNQEPEVQQEQRPPTYDELQAEYEEVSASLDMSNARRRQMNLTIRQQANRIGQLEQTVALLHTKLNARGIDMMELLAEEEPAPKQPQDRRPAKKAAAKKAPAKKAAATAKGKN